MTPRKIKKNAFLPKLKKRLEELTKTDIKVGYFEDSGSHSQAKVPYAVLMCWHELGLGNYPARPAIDIGGELVIQSFRKGEFRRQVSSLLIEGVKQNILNNIATGMTEIVSDVFGSSKLVDNADSTISRKGDNSPLIETGELLSNIGYKINDGETVKPISE